MTKISYKVKYSKRKTLNISVERDNSVIVRAPDYLTEEKIEQIVNSKQQWIKEKQCNSQKYPINTDNKEFVSGESLMFLGKNYQLSVINKEFESIEFNKRFRISKNKQPEANALFRKWYQQQAKEILEPLAIKLAKNLGVRYEQFKVSGMKYRWASCTKTNNIIFNWRIIKAPMYVLEYIVAHELVHLIEPNHTPDFWNILSIQVPHYIKAKNWLKKYGHLLEVDWQ